jgi:hypothetical protein
VNKQLCHDGAPVTELYAVHEISYVDEYRDNFPSEPNLSFAQRGWQMAAHEMRNGELVVPAGNWATIATIRSTTAITDSFPRTTSSGGPD